MRLASWWNKIRSGSPFANRYWGNKWTKDVLGTCLFLFILGRILPTHRGEKSYHAHFNERRFIVMCPKKDLYSLRVRSDDIKFLIKRVLCISAFTGVLLFYFLSVGVIFKTPSYIVLQNMHFILSSEAYICPWFSLCLFIVPIPKTSQLYTEYTHELLFFVHKQAILKSNLFI